VSEKENKRELTYCNFVAIDGVIKNQLDFFNLTNPSSHTMALGLTQPLAEMSTRNLPGGSEPPARKADLTTICEPIV
jgi:hypothetical protein